VTDSHLVVKRNDDYVLGRPKIDEIEIRFIQDPSSVLASLLARAQDITLGRSLIPLEHKQNGVAGKHTWRNGSLKPRGRASKN